MINEVGAVPVVVWFICLAAITIAAIFAWHEVFKK